MSQNDQSVASEDNKSIATKSVVKKWPNHREDYELKEVIGIQCFLYFIFLISFWGST